MPLDPLVKAYLDKTAAAQRPRAWDMTPDEVRQAFATVMQQTGPKDMPVGRIENFTIPGPGGDMRARLFSRRSGRAAADTDFFPWRRFRGGRAGDP